MRVLSLLAGVAVPLVAFIVARKFVSSAAALGVAALYTFNTILCYQAVIIRNYAVLTLISLVAIGSAVDGFLKGRRHSLVIFALAALIVAYTHYLGTLVLAFAYVCLAVKRIYLSRSPNAYELLVLTLTTLGCALVVVFAIRHLIHTPYQHLLPSFRFDPLRILWLTGVINVGYGHIPSNISYFITGAMACAGFAVLWRHGDRAIALVLGGGVIIVTALFLVVSSRIATIPYYVTHVLFFAATLISAPLDYLGRFDKSRLTNVIAVGSVGVVLTSAWFSLTTDIWQSKVGDSNWREVAAAMRAEQRNGERYVILGWDAVPVTYYLDTKDWLTSYAFSAAIEAKCDQDYLILDSPHGRRGIIPQEASYVGGFAGGAQLWRFTCRSLLHPPSSAHPA